MPSSKRAVATVLAATQTGFVVFFLAKSAEQITRRGGAVAHRADLVEAQRVADQRRLHHLLERELLAEARVGIVDGVLVRLDRDLRELLLGRAVILHAAAADHRPEGGARDADAALPQVLGVGRLLDSGGLDEALRHLLAADDEHHVVQAARDERVADVEGVAARRAAGREVVDRDAGRAHVLDDVVAVQSPALAAREARARGRDGLDLAPRDARVCERRVDGDATQIA